MPRAFVPDQTVRLGKYVLARNPLAGAWPPCRPPQRRLTVDELLAERPGDVRRLEASGPRVLPACCFDYRGSDPRYHGGQMPEVRLPATSVVVIERGRVVGRTGTVHVPAADACIVEFEWPTHDLRGFRGQLPGGGLHPRYWKQFALRQWRQRIMPAVRQCPGRVAVLNGASPHNFFHWMSEILPRLTTLRRAGLEADWYVVDAHARFQREALSMLGVPLARVIQPHATLHLEADTLLVPALQPFQDLPSAAAALADGIDAGNTPGSRRVFIDRRRTRRVANVAAFDGALERFGFRRCFLEDLSLREQIELFRDADVILGLHGAGLTNIMHCRPGTLVVEVMPAGVVRPCYPLLSRIFGLRHVMLSAPRHGWHHDVMIPLDELARIIPHA